MADLDISVHSFWNAQFQRHTNGKTLTSPASLDSEQCRRIWFSSRPPAY